MENRQGLNPLEDADLKSLDEAPQYYVHANVQGVMELYRYIASKKETTVLMQSPKYAPAWEYATFIARNYNRKASKKFGSAEVILD